MTQAVVTHICDSCIEAMEAYAENLGYDDFSERRIKWFARNLGGEIADHYCEAVEHGADPCRCGCIRYRE